MYCTISSKSLSVIDSKSANVSFLKNNKRKQTRLIYKLQINCYSQKPGIFKTATGNVKTVFLNTVLSQLFTLFLNTFDWLNIKKPTNKHEG